MTSKKSDTEEIASLDDRIQWTSAQLHSLVEKRDMLLLNAALRRQTEKTQSRKGDFNRAYYLRYQDTTVEENGKWYPTRSIRQVSEAMGVSRGSANLCVINAELELKKNNIICSKHNPYLGVICDWLDQVSSL